MAVRPFYINADIDGRKTPLAGGTKKKDGDHTISIYQRDNGAITTPYKVYQHSFLEMRDDGKEHLVLETQIIFQGDVIHTHRTDY